MEPSHAVKRVRLEVLTSILLMCIASLDAISSETGCMDHGDTCKPPREDVTVVAQAEQHQRPPARSDRRGGRGRANEREEESQTIHLKHLGVSFTPPAESSWVYRSLIGSDAILRQLPLPAVVIQFGIKTEQKSCALHLAQVAKTASGSSADGASWMPPDWHPQVVAWAVNDVVLLNGCLPLKAGVLIARIAVHSKDPADTATLAAVRNVLQAATPTLLQITPVAPTLRAQLELPGLGVTLQGAAQQWSVAAPLSAGESRDRLQRRDPSEPKIVVDLERVTRYADCPSFLLEAEAGFEPLADPVLSNKWQMENWSSFVMHENKRGYLLCFPATNGVVSAIAQSSSPWRDEDITSVRGLLEALVEPLRR